MISIFRVKKKCFQYLVWPPLALITAWQRLRIEKMHRRMSTCGIACHSCCKAANNRVAVCHGIQSPLMTWTLSFVISADSSCHDDHAPTHLSDSTTHSNQRSAHRVSYTRVFYRQHLRHWICFRRKRKPSPIGDGSNVCGLLPIEEDFDDA